MNSSVATIGFAKKGLERFVELLVLAGVETIIDIRRRPDSPLAGYARKRDLPFVLDRVAGIGYEHRPELAPPDELLDRFRKDKDWGAYVRDFENVLTSAAAMRTMSQLLGRSDRVALLCSEHMPEKCHRRLVVERMRGLEPRLNIDHLV